MKDDFHIKNSRCGGKNPGILEYLESILPFSGPKDNHPHHSKLETLPMVSMMRKGTSTQSPKGQFQIQR